MFMGIKKTFNQHKNCSLDKTGEGNVVSDLAISAQKYPKIVTQEKEKFQGIRDSVFQNYVVFLRSFDVVFHMFMCVNETFHQNKKCSWDKTGEGNVLLDLAISAQKYPKIVTQEKEKCWHVAACFWLVSMLDIPTRTWGLLGLTRGAHTY